MIADSGALKLQGACFTNQSKRRFLTEVHARVRVREEIVIQFTSIGCFYLYLRAYHHHLRVSKHIVQLSAATFVIIFLPLLRSVTKSPLCWESC